MQSFAQSPTDPDFVQDPYPTYRQMRAAGDLIWWNAYSKPCATSHAAVHALLRDPRFGRAVPADRVVPPPMHLAPFYRIEAHSMLELEPPRHTRLRGLVLRAFTSRRIAAMTPQITALCHELIDVLPPGEVDLLPSFCERLPVIVIARLLGVPTDMAPQLLHWSHAMVAMYQARRDRQIEEAAATAAHDFSTYLRELVAARRAHPADDLLTHLIAAESDGDRLSADELIATCVLLLNAGHEATVHSLGNGVKTLLDHGQRVTSQTAADTSEEILRYDPPLHMFTRYAYEDMEVFGHRFSPGDEVALLLGAANRDALVFSDPDRFDIARAKPAHVSLGGGRHFCVGAPLARLEIEIALPILFDRLPGLALSRPPRYANSYHFHGLEALWVTRA